MRAARLPLLLWGAWAAACSEGPLPPVPDAGPPPRVALARLTLAQGSVELGRDGKPARPAEIEDLYDQDLVITGAGARAILKFKGGGELELAQSSRFRVTASAANVDVDLQTGIISLIDGEGVALVTPYGRTTLGGDARARLDKEGDGLTLDLLVGEITQLEEDGGAVRVKAGQKLRFQVGAISVIDDSGEAAPAQPLPVAWVPVEGSTELKKKGEKRFTRVKDKVELTEGTAFKVAGNGKARLEAPGLSAQVGGGTSGAVERAGQKGKRRQVEVSLGGGLLELQFAGDGETELFIPAGGAVARVKGRQRSQVRVVATGKGVKVIVLTGEVEIASGEGEAKTVKAGEAAVVDKAQVEVGALKKPPLLLPMGKRVRVFGVGRQEVGLDLPDEAADVEVASDGAFQQTLLAGRAQGFVTLVDPPPAVFWRTLDAQGQPAKTGKATFLSERREGKSETASFPVNEWNEKTDVNFQTDELPALKLEWRKAEGAAGYKVSVYPWGATAPAFEAKVKETSLLVESGRLKEGRYSWLAMPLDANGGDKPGLRELKKNPQLTISFDNSAAGLAIRSPAKSERATSATRARGVAPLGSKLYLNGAAVSLDEKGRYDVRVGKTSPLIFRSVAPDGSEDYWVRTTR